MHDGNQFDQKALFCCQNNKNRLLKLRISHAQVMLGVRLG